MKYLDWFLWASGLATFGAGMFVITLDKTESFILGAVVGIFWMFIGIKINKKISQSTERTGETLK